MDEMNNIFHYHPELIYFPNPVQTWSGYMSIKNPLNPSVKEHIKMKLIVPNYPEMTGLEINFGSEIAVLISSKFKTKIEDAIKRSSSVFILLQQIESIFVSLYPFNRRFLSNGYKQNMIEQLAEVLSQPQQLYIYSTKSLEEITLITKQISLTLRWKNLGWEIVSSDLQDLMKLDLKKRQLSLKSIINLLLENIEEMTEVWRQLEEIDSNCHVIDPKSPKPYHLYRRIYYNDYLSVSVSLDPSTFPPDIKFLGSEVSVQKYKQKHMERLNDWESDTTVYDYLLDLFEIEEFPRLQKVEKSTVNACFDDNECCICFSLESEEGSQPDKVCPNVKCCRVFHSYCLLKWLQYDGTNKIIFGDIYGKCPHCEESISCSINN